MLEWLAGVTEPWSGSTTAKMLDRAAWFDKLAAAQWLRARGAAWPTKFIGQFFMHGGDEIMRYCWSLSTAQWAVACGSGWLEWKCEDYAASCFRSVKLKRQACAVLQWAHANGRQQ
jgi:hypothetical protein